MPGAFLRYLTGLFGKIDFLALVGGIVHRLHHAGGDDSLVDMGRKLFAGADAADEAVDLVLEHIVRSEFGFERNEPAASGGINGEIAAVLETCARLGTDKVDIGFGNAISQEVGSGLKFEKAYFESEVVVNGKATSKYTAKIVDTIAFLGVNDAQNATIEVIVNTEAKTLASTTIKYDVVKTSGTYAVEIVVKVG